VSVEIGLQRRSVPFEKAEEIHLDQAPKPLLDFSAPGILLDAALQDTGMIPEETFLRLVSEV
jgi:hypothetical protein